MRGTPVLAAAFVLAAAPAAAQQIEWSEDRPDAVAPVGIVGDRTLPRGTAELAYRFAHSSARGLRFGTDDVLESDLLDLGFTFVPTRRTVNAHMVTAGLGLTDQVTVLASVAWLEKNRTTANDSVIFFSESSGIADAQADVLWEFFREGAYRSHLQLGVIVPVGSFEERGDFPQAADVVLPYDMQIGSGSWAVAPGLTGQVQNDVGSVGAQVRGVFSLTDNDRDWRPGTRVEGRMWAAYRFNDFVSASGGVRGYHSESIQGADPELETLRDPGDLALSFATERVDLPLGVNLRIPSGPLAGQRLMVEAVWTVHEETDGPLLADDWGFVVGWQSTLGGPGSGLANLWPF